MQRTGGGDPHAGIAVGEAGRVDHHKGLGPSHRAARFARSVDGHVVRFAFPGAAVPRDQQFAVGQFDDAWGVVVLGMEWEDEFGGEVWGGGFLGLPSSAGSAEC